MDEEEAVAVDVLALDELELEFLYQMMANMAAVIISQLEVDDDVFLEEGSWHKVTVNTDDFLTMGDPSFKLHFRMSRTAFEALVEVVGNYLVEVNRFQRERTPLHLILMMVLWVMATQDSFRSVALQFGVVPSTLHYHYLYIIEALREMAPRFITWPNERERTETKEYFERATGFFGVVGCLDGTHHNIVAPQYDAIRYVNRKQCYSMNTQYVCDHRLLIRDVYVGEAGSVHDSRVFRRSPLCTALLEDETKINFDEHILGDGGYILTNSVLTPFRNNGRLTPLQTNYNRLHAQIRGRVENCNARLKMKWRRTKFLHAMHQEVVVDHIIASAVLHNFVILHEEDLFDLLGQELAVPLDGEELDDDVEEFADPDLQYPNVPGEPDHDLMAEARQLGVEKRLHVMRHLPRVFA